MRHLATRRHLGILSAALALSTLSFADDLDNAIREQERIERESQNVNGGELEFLSPRDRTRPMHHQRDRVVLSADSRRSGWVGLQQCHYDLAAVSTTELVFNTDRTRGLEVESFAGIRQVVIEDSRVVLHDVTRGAYLCLRADSRSLTADGNGGYVLRSGPYLRRFLDGYYPLHVSLEVIWPEDALRLWDVLPPPQSGLHMQADSRRLLFDAWFRGTLVTEFYFDAG